MKLGFVLSLLMAAAAMAQPAPDTLWTKRYGGVHSDRIRDLQQTEDGGYILAGYSLSFSAETRYWLIRTNEAGDTLWTRLFGPVNDAFSPHILVTGDGQYLLLTTSTDQGGDIRLSRLDSLGNELWVRTYGGFLEEYGTSIQSVQSGGYIIAGMTSSNGSDGDLYLIRMTETGDTLWTHTYDGGGTDIAADVRETPDHGFALLGSVANTHLYLVKTDSVGNEQWHRSYGWSGSYSASDMIVTHDGGYAMAGLRSSSGNWFYVVRTNSNGDTLWMRSYANANSDAAVNVVETEDGGLVVGGHRGPLGGERFYLSKINAEGSLVWEQTYNTGSWHDLCFVMRQTQDHGFMLGGSSWYQNAMPQDARIVKIAPTCTLPMAPYALTVYRNGTDLRVSWQAVTQTVEGCQVFNPQYQVYRSASADGPFDLIGNTTTLSFDDPMMPDEGARFYVVTAMTP